MASKPKAKAAPAPEEEAPAAPAEEAVKEVSYKLSLPESLVMLRDIDISSLSDDDRRAAILEIKALLEALEAVDHPHDDHQEQRLWLLQTWDNVIKLRLDDVRHERNLPDFSVKVTRLFDEAKLALAAAEEAARIEAEKAAEEAARLEAEAKAKAEADAAAALAAEHGEETAASTDETHADHHDEEHDETQENPEDDHDGDHHDEVSAEAHDDEHHEEEAHDDHAAQQPEETAEIQAETGSVDLEPAEAHESNDGEGTVSEGDYQGSEPNLSLEAGDDGFVKLRLLEHTEIANIRLPAHINIEIPLEHAEELVNKDTARPLRADEEFEPKE